MIIMIENITTGYLSRQTEYQNLTVKRAMTVSHTENTEVNETMANYP
jgi:hypothetical protein